MLVLKLSQGSSLLFVTSLGRGLLPSIGSLGLRSLPAFGSFVFFVARKSEVVFQESKKETIVLVGSLMLRHLHMAKRPQGQ